MLYWHVFIQNMLHGSQWTLDSQKITRRTSSYAVHFWPVQFWPSSPPHSGNLVNGGRPDHFAVDQPTLSPKLMVFGRMRRDGKFCLKIFRNENVTGASYHWLPSTSACGDYSSPRSSALPLPPSMNCRPTPPGRLPRLTLHWCLGANGVHFEKKKRSSDHHM